MIKIEDYNPEWKDEFEKAKKFYSKILLNIEVDIIHVGSTSVKGLAAKSILDIDIVVNNKEDSKKVISVLEKYDYEHVGCLGVEGREVLHYDEKNKYINWMQHHLYVCIKGNENLENHLLLKRHLLQNEQAVVEYGNLKKNLAKKYKNDIDSYIEGKSVLIIKYLNSEGMKVEKLNKIKEINKKG